MGKPRYMKTLREIIIEAKCRKGTATGTTKHGAFWQALAKPGEYFSRTSNRGDDGIGNNAADVKVFLEFRHYRDGTVTAVLIRESWHQNYGSTKTVTRVDQLLDATTAEEVVVVLKGVDLVDGGGRAIDAKEEADLINELVAIGLPTSLPSPDDVAEEVE